MRVLTIYVVVVCLTAGLGSGSAKAQADSLNTQVLADHLRPAWIPAFIKADQIVGDNVLASLKELKGQGKRQRPTLLLVCSEENPNLLAAFEQNLFQHPRLILVARIFCCLKLDVKRNKAIGEVYGRAIPRFLLFDAKGRRRADISMAEFRLRPDALLEVMKKIVSKYGALPLDKFLGRYRTLLRDLVPLEIARKKIEEQEAALSVKRGARVMEELQKLRTRLQELAGRKKNWLVRERKLLTHYHKGKR